MADVSTKIKRAMVNSVGEGAPKDKPEIFLHPMQYWQ
jgi:hypothetical protein